MLGTNKNIGTHKQGGLRAPFLLSARQVSSAERGAPRPRAQGAGRRSQGAGRRGADLGHLIKDAGRKAQNISIMINDARPQNLEQGRRVLEPCAMVRGQALGQQIRSIVTVKRNNSA